MKTVSELDNFAHEFFTESLPESVVEWGESNEYLSERITEQAGLYSTASFPYVREILEAFADPKVKKISLCWGSQTSKTTTLYVGAGWTIDRKPCPILFVYPNAIMARNFSNDRFLPFLEDSRSLAKHLPKTLDGKIDRDRATAMRIELDRCTVNLVGGGSQANVRNYPVSLLILDEIDVIPEEIRREAMDRVKGRRAYKIIQSSTPLEETTGIWGEFIEGDQRRFLIPCPHCGDFIPLNWKEPEAEKVPPHLSWKTYNIQFDRARASLRKASKEDAQEADWDYSSVRETAVYLCQNCKGEIDDNAKAKAMRAGKWEPSNPNAEDGVRSYHLSSLYSPILRFGDIMVKWLQNHREVGGLKAFVQGWLAEPWREELANVDDEAISELSGDYERGELKGEFRILSIDVQRSFFWWVVRGFNKDGSSWLIDHGQCPTFGGLDEIYERLQCSFACIDTGYGDRAQECYEAIFTRRKTWVGVKGWKTLPTPYKWANIDPFTGSAKQGKHKIRLLHIDATIWQGELAKRRANQVDNWRLYRRPAKEYVKQLQAKWLHEQTDKRGNTKREWRTKRHAGEHFWDCETYVLAFSKSLGAGNVARSRESENSVGVSQPVSRTERNDAARQFWRQ